MAEGQASNGGQDRPGKAPAIYTPPPPLRRPRTWIAAAAVVAILAVVVFVWDPWRTTRVTDGSEVLAEYLTPVQSLILAENSRVTGSGRPWVSIALMLPIRTTDEVRSKKEDVLRHFQGAYLAQYWSNHPTGDNEFGTDVPLIKILLADTGQDGQEWRDTVAQLVDMAHPESGGHLVAAAGLGLSTDATQEAANALAAERIPMVGSVITATGLTAPGLVRVAPTNSDEAAAIIEYLRSTPDWQSATATTPYKAYLVQDRAEDDTYVEDLGNQYREGFRNNATHTLLDVQGDYDSQRPGAGNAIEAQIATICSIRPKIVFFAGRSDGLRTFLGKLSARHCTDAPITVVSGDGAGNLIHPDTGQLWVNNANLDVLYTALASPQTWQEQYRELVSPDTVARFGQCTNCFDALFTESFDDGDAIMSHDAVLTAVAAARNVASQKEPRPTAEALVNGLYQINAAKPVPGASGWIYFQRERGTPDGVPYNKAMPIMRLNPDGTATVVALSSRSGTPAIPRLPR